jgi:dynein heavy chain 1
LRGREGILPGQPTIKMAGLNSDQLEGATALSKLRAFKNLQEKINEFKEFNDWVKSSSPETNVPQLWNEEKPLTPIGTVMHQLLVIKSFRPDRVIAMANQVVNTILDSDFLHAAEAEFDLGSIIEKEIKASTPILMCSVPGYDASGRVDDLAAELNKTITSIAIGSAEGFSQAEKSINSASKNGKWVLLKNVHLAPQWLIQLEKKLHTLQTHPTFRLFLTLEIHPKVPVNLLRAGRIFVFEPPPGIRANLLRTFSTIPASRMMKAPNERSRLYFLLSWFHAIVQERLRYCPLGWSKRYEFNESDLKVACDTLDTWIDTVAMGRTNLPPEKVPWDAICILFGQCIYGGKIDNDFDQRLLTSFLNKLFTPRSFDPEFALVAGVERTEDGKSSITIPEGILRRDQFLNWVESLPDRQTPSWLGLPNNAEKVLLTNHGIDIIAKLLKLQLLEDDDDILVQKQEGIKAKRDSSDGRPAWMRTLLNSATTWLRLIPNNLQTMKRTSENIKEPLYRYFEREVNMASKLLYVVRRDLEDVQLICKGEKKQTNYDREIIAFLAKGMIPTHWRKYTVPQTCTVIQWITDFTDRIKQLQKVSSTSSLSLKV